MTNKNSTISEQITEDIKGSFITVSAEGKITDIKEASSHTSRLYGGTGLGLANVKQLIEPQDGQIHVKSIEDYCSTLSFTLPFLKTIMKDEIEKNNIEIGTELKNIKVLIVEDIPLNQLLIKTILDDFGFQHESAENGAIAIEKLKKNHFDVVLMDIQMPVMNGFEATEYIRKTLDLRIPIIALTADVTTVDLKICQEAGMNDYLAKPVDERILFRKIVAIINKSHHSKIDINKTEVNKETIKKGTFIDLTYLLKITKSNPNLMMQMIEIYLTQTPIIINSIKESLTTKNWISLTAAAHKIVPSFAIVGINNDYEEVAKKIQNLSTAGQDTIEMKDLVLRLEQVCSQACIELEQELQKIKSKI